MSRPDFPNPYCILTPSMISRINSDQQYYDEDPERYERQERARQEQRELDQRQEQEELDIFMRDNRDEWSPF